MDFNTDWLDELQPLKFMTAQAWCDRNILVKKVQFEDEMVPALCITLDISEHELHIKVRDEFLDKSLFTPTTVQCWTETARLTEAQLLMHYSTLGQKVDGLFIWLASVVTRYHLNSIHDNGIWTSHASETLDLRDALLVITEMQFLAAKSQTWHLTKMVFVIQMSQVQNSPVSPLCYVIL